MSIENRLQLLESKAKLLQQEMLVMFIVFADSKDGALCEIPATCWRCDDQKIYIEPDESADDFKARAESTFKGLCNPGFSLVIYQDNID